MQFYRHHLGDYLRDTAHLSLLEHGAYRRLIDLYYLREGPLPKDTTEVCRKVGSRSRQDRNATVRVLREFFQEGDDGWHSWRCDAEIQAFFDKSEKARQSAKCKRTHSERIANGERSRGYPLPATQLPVKREEKEAASPPGLDPQAWKDWTAYRRGIGKPIKPVSEAAAMKKLAAFGKQQAAVVEQSVAQGWTGLFALRTDPRQSPPDKPVPTTAQIQAQRTRAAEQMANQALKMRLPKLRP